MKIRSVESTQWDLLSLGECMIRLSPPGHERVEYARSFDVYVGGGEYNVAYALARLGLRTAWVGGLVANPLGDLVKNHSRAVGLDVSQAITVPHDGVGRSARMGLNFTEVGVGPRASTTLYDRGNTPTAHMQPGQVDWDDIFTARGVRWLHTGGIFTCLSPTTRLVAAEALKAAHEAGVIVSYDLNFRGALWSSKEAIETTRPLVQYIDCLIGNEEDFQKVLGYEIPDADENLSSLSLDSYKAMVREVVRDFPNLSVVGTTLREVVSATVNNWSAVLYETATDTFHEGPTFEAMQIEDRVGGGDGFASGFAYAFLSGQSAADAVRIGTAHGALLQTTRGDTSQITVKELERVAAGGSARIVR